MQYNDITTNPIWWTDAILKIAYVIYADIHISVQTYKKCSITLTKYCIYTVF